MFRDTTNTLKMINNHERTAPIAVQPHTRRTPNPGYVLKITRFSSANEIPVKNVMPEVILF